MLISEIIKKLEGFQKKYGDVPVVCLTEDGVSTWVSDYNPNIVLTKKWPMKKVGYLIEHDGY